MLVSSKTGEGVDELFNLVNRKFLSQYHGITPADPNKPHPAKLAWHQNDNYKKDRAEFEAVWNNPAHKTNKDKIIACLNSYTKNDSAMSRFFSGTWRSQVDDVSAICRVNKTRTNAELLKDLKGINLKNDKGTCAVMIDMIEDKLNPKLGAQQQKTKNQDMDDDWFVMSK